MGYRLRALISVSAVTLVAAGALVSTAAPSGAQEVAAVDCGSTTYRFLYWPEGHGALKSVPHPATDVPHLDVYSGKGKKFLDTQNVAYADGTSVTTNATCVPAALPGSGSATLRNLSQTKQLVCKFPSNPVFVSVPQSTVDLPSLSAVVGDALVVNAQLGTPGVGSSVDYDAKYCKVKKAPK
jgi:hypothetical protein